MSFTVRFRVWGTPGCANHLFWKLLWLEISTWSKNCTLNCTFQAHSDMCCLGFCSVVDCLNYIVPITMHRLLRNHFKIHFTDCVKVECWRRKLRMLGLWCFGSSSNRRFPLDHIQLCDSCGTVTSLKGWLSISAVWRRVTIAKKLNKHDSIIDIARLWAIDILA